MLFLHVAQSQMSNMYSLQSKAASDFLLYLDISSHIYYLLIYIGSIFI